MAASDLATLADVKTWLSGSSGIGSSDDVLLARLITDVSGAIAAYLGRPSLTPHAFTERLDGDGKARLYLRHYPVLAITSLVIGHRAVAPAAAPAAGSAACENGFLLEPWDGMPPGRLQALDVFGTCFHKGRQNVVVSYSAGYAVTGESATVPGAPGPYTVTAAVPFGPWASDSGVTYANGAALTGVTSNPVAGQYAVAGGIYTFAAADAGAAVLISYGFIPAAINNACIEWVAERYRYRTRIGQSAQTVQGQQTASYSLKDLPDFIRASLDPFGLGGLSTSPGMLTLAAKIRQLGKTFVVLGPYDQSEWEQAADDLAHRPKTDLIGAIGYSLGANNVVEIAAEVARKVDYIAGIQPSYWGLGVDWSGTITLPSNVGSARNIYNPNFLATFGLGFARYAAPAGFSGKLQISATSDLHPDVDNDAGVHGFILGDLKKVAA